MEYNQNNISTIISMIVPFLAYIIAIIFKVNVDQALLTMFITGVVELIILIWSARHTNTMGVFGNAPTPIDPTEPVLNDEYESDGA